PVPDSLERLGEGERAERRRGQELGLAWPVAPRAGERQADDDPARRITQVGERAQQPRREARFEPAHAQQEALIDSFQPFEPCEPAAERGPGARLRQRLGERPAHAAIPRSAAGAKSGVPAVSGVATGSSRLPGRTRSKCPRQQTVPRKNPASQTARTAKSLIGIAARPNRSSARPRNASASLASRAIRRSRPTPAPSARCQPISGPRLPPLAPARARPARNGAGRRSGSPR